MRKAQKSFRLALMIIISIVIMISAGINSFAVMYNYEKTKFSSAYVKCDILNVRSGPGLNYPIVYKAYNLEKLRVFAKINGWYLVQSDGNNVGMVRGDLIDPNKQNAVLILKSSIPKATPTAKLVLTTGERQLFNLINDARGKAGVRKLKVDSILIKISRLKAEDLVKNNYFSHTSPTYGLPFDMMKKYGVRYRIAGENIAGNSSIRGAFNALMKSDGHRKNIMNKNYNYIGIGIVDSKTYGMVMVQEFVGR